LDAAAAGTDTKPPGTADVKPPSILKKSVQFSAGVKSESSSDKKDKRSKDSDAGKALKAAQEKEAGRKPEGRVGTLVVMKSGRVKMVLGDGVVMDVSVSGPKHLVASKTD
jgi:hypothetical protein